MLKWETKRVGKVFPKESDKKIAWDYYNDIHLHQSQYQLYLHCNDISTH
jgi:hypothetical protein